MTNQFYSYLRKKIGKRNVQWTSALFAMFLLFSTQSFSQISGTILDDTGEVLIGAAVLEKGTSNGTVTDINGQFTLNVKEGTVLEISYTGYQTQEVVAANDMRAVLEEGVGLDEIVVTGVFDARSRMESSIAISTLEAKQMNRLTPVSSADLFANTPDVFVNSSAGEVRNQVYARGISAGSNYSLTSNANGYYYVSLQEDGLPVTAISDALFVSDTSFFWLNIMYKLLDPGTNHKVLPNYLNPETHLLEWLEFTVRDIFSMATGFNKFTNFKEVQGIKLPMSQFVTQGTLDKPAKKLHENHYKKLSFN